MDELCLKKKIPQEYLGKSQGPRERIPNSQALVVQDAECTRPNPESLKVIWRNVPELESKNSYFVPHSNPDARANAQHPFPSAAYDDPRVWTPNLNNYILERTKQNNSEEFDVYKHMQARQKFSQFIQAGVLKRRDKWARSVPVESVIQIHAQQEPARAQQQTIVNRELEKRRREIIEAQQLQAAYKQY